MSGMDVAAWNAENPDHPRAGDGRFSLVGSVVRALQEAFGESLHHTEVGAADHPLSDRGALMVHHGGSLSVSVLDEDDRHQTIAHLGSADVGDLNEYVESSIYELESANLEPGTHLVWNEDAADDDPLPVVGYGVLEDGERYLSLDSRDGEHSLQLNLEHAQEFSAELSEATGRAHNAAVGEDPLETRPLPEGHTLERRKAIDGGDRDVISGLVATPEGLRLRVGIGGTYEHPVKGWTGGRGPMVADLGPDEAGQLEMGLKDAAAEMAGYAEALQEAVDLEEEWYEATASGRRLSELTLDRDRGGQHGWRLYGGADGSHIRRPTGERGPNGGRLFEDAPPEVDAEIRALRAERDAVTSEYDLVPEGEVFSSQEIETSWGTISIDLLGWSPDAEDIADAHVRVRPRGTTREQWESGAGEHEPAAILSLRQVKALRKLVAGYLETAGQVAKSARGAASKVDRDRIAREGRKYWTRTAEGLGKWAKKAHPMRALHRHLAQHMNPELAWRLAASYFKSVFGYAPSARQGKNPVGRG